MEKLGDWCKWLEKNFSPEVAIPGLPLVIRLDGVNFHNWCKGLKKPFDRRFISLMEDTTKRLVEETNAVVGYTQSDEITLMLYSSDRNSSLYHGGKKQKILSKLTGVCCNHFNFKRKDLLPEHGNPAVFDCRVYQVPTLSDAVAQLIWRENDAVKNSIQALAQSLFSHKSLHGLNGGQLQDKMTTECGVNWNDLPSEIKRGIYIRRIKTKRPFTAEELQNLPPKHHAHKNPHLKIERNVIERVEYPPINKIKNKVATFFYEE